MGKKTTSAATHAIPATPFTGSAVKELHAEDFVLTKNPVQLHSRHRPGYIMFYAEWCGHCHHQIPALKAFATQAAGRCGVYAVDCSTPDRNPALQQAVKVSGYPTFFRVDPQTHELQEGAYHVADQSPQELESRITEVSTLHNRRAASAVDEGDSSRLRRRSLEANKFASDSKKPIKQRGGASKPKTSPIAVNRPQLCQGRTYNGLFRCTQMVDAGQTYCWRHGGPRRQH